VRQTDIQKACAGLFEAHSDVLRVLDFTTLNERNDLPEELVNVFMLQPSVEEPIYTKTFLEHLDEVLCGSESVQRSQCVRNFTYFHWLAVAVVT
jgi:hypothetical protein